MRSLITEFILRLAYCTFSSPSKAHSLQSSHTAFPPPAALCNGSLKLLALSHWFGNTLSLESENVNIFPFAIRCEQLPPAHFLFPPTFTLTLHGADEFRPDHTPAGPPSVSGCHHMFYNSKFLSAHSHSRNRL